MGETSERIVRHIDDERERLGRNLDQLERKVDIQKTRVRNTAIAVGSIVGGSVLVGLLLGRLRR